MSDLKSVPFLDLTQQYTQVQQEWLETISEAGRTGQFIQGPNVTALESEIAAYCGTRYAVAVANGTDALVLSLLALGVGKGDEVITTPFTFFASAESITSTGATPVFVDIDAQTFNLDVNQVESKITESTKAVMPVHLFGCPVEMDNLCALAVANRLNVIEDCAQAFGADWQDRRVGSWGKVGAFSFYPTKILACYGDGGMVVTDSEEVVESIRRLSNHGATGSFIHDTVGCNSRLDEIQASLLRIKLRQIDNVIERRRVVANFYNEKLSGMDVVLPKTPTSGGHVFNVYTIQVPNRDEVKRSLKATNIGFSVCYPVPLHLQKVYAHLNYREGDFPVCEQLSHLTISLPIFPEMSAQQVERVCEVIESVVSPSRKHRAVS